MRITICARILYYIDIIYTRLRSYSCNYTHSGHPEVFRVQIICRYTRDGESRVPIALWKIKSAPARLGLARANIDWSLFKSDDYRRAAGVREYGGHDCCRRGCVTGSCSRRPQISIVLYIMYFGNNNASYYRVVACLCFKIHFAVHANIPPMRVSSFEVCSL